MFNPHAENLSSTGEPPTPENRNTGQNIVYSSSDSQTNNLSLASSRSTVQEPDSGYEASPSSITDNQFFGEQSNSNRQSETRQSSDDEFDIINFHSPILFESESEELDDYDTCIDSSPIGCLRTDSSISLPTNTTANSINCDNTSRRNSSDLSFNRPSSNPIQIPCRITSEVNSSRIIIGSPVDICPFSRSQPSNFSPFRMLGFIPERHPISWPETTSPMLSHFRNILISPSHPSNRNPPHSNFSRRNIHHVRSRRQLIDSDLSSYDSDSEDEGEEDVFSVPGEASSYPTMLTMNSVPLPDVVLQSTDTGRRSRSMSINLPPDRQQVIHEVGQRLRRMSDLFEHRRQVRMVVVRARSRTASECDDHLRRNGLS